MKIHFTLLFLCFSLYLSAQTFLGPTIGYDFANLSTPPISYEYVSERDGETYEAYFVERTEKDSGAGLRSIAFGFQAQKMLSPKWSLGIRGSYSRKEYLANIKIFISSNFAGPIRPINYQHYSISILFNRKIRDKVSIGIGPNISYFSQWSDPDGIPYNADKRSYGLDLQVGYHLGPVYLAVDYTRSLKVIDSADYVKHFSNLAISGTYFFELRKRK